eukprot:SAG11_NODE_827_length_6974_cov_4.300945_3_plen_403_part_00
MWLLNPTALEFAGHVDLYLGYWNSDGSDMILRNDGKGVLGGKGGEGGWRVGEVTLSGYVKSGDKQLAAKHQRTSSFTLDQAYENTMGMQIGDLNDDGFPDVIIGSGTPSWSEHDVLWTNMGNVRSSSNKWAGFSKHVLGPGLGGEKTRGHGICFGDLDRNWHTDVLLNVGGFALTDTLLAGMWDERAPYDCDIAGPSTLRSSGRGDEPCDSREAPIAYLRESDVKGYRQTLAAVHLEGTRSNRNAVGARIAFTPSGTNVSSTAGLFANPKRSEVEALSARTLGAWAKFLGYDAEVVANAMGTKNPQKTLTRHIMKRHIKHESEVTNTRHVFVGSTNGFQSQNSAWHLFNLADQPYGHVEIRWPSGLVSKAVVVAGQRLTVTEPESKRSADGEMQVRTGNRFW